MKKLLITLALLSIVFFIPNEAYVQVNLSEAYASMSAQHILGCDNLGRDLFSLMQTAFIRSIEVVVIGAGLGVIGGLLMGVYSGYKGGKWEAVLNLVGDFSLVIPSFIVALIISAFFGLTPVTVGISIAVFDVGVYGMQAAALTKTVKQKDFIIAEKLIGTSDLKIIFRHIMPNISEAVQTNFANKSSSIVIKYASLSFIGLGADMSKPDFGMLLYSYRVVMFEHPSLVILPSLGIFAIALFFHLVFDKNVAEKEGKLSI